MKVLNVGSGNRPMPNEKIAEMLKSYFKIEFPPGTKYVNIDQLDLGQDCIIDLDKKKLKLPFKDDTFDAVLIVHVLEHIQNIIPLMEELWRVTKPESKCYIQCPYWTDKWAVGDIDHKRMINEYTFIWFDQNCYKNNRLRNTQASPCRVKCDWRYDIEKDFGFIKNKETEEITEIVAILTCRK